MKAIILAGGYGARLGSLTKDLPKPLLKVGNKTVIEQIIDRLNLHGIYQIIVNTHYLPIHIEKALEIRALYYYVPRLLGHKGTIYALKDWLKGDDFFVINGDTLSNVNYTEMVNMRHSDGILTLMDEYRCVGTWLYPEEYLTQANLPIVPYRPSDLIWHDIGNRKRLKEAREYYEAS